MIIYKVKNILNGKVYIGQTVQPLVNRWSKHCSNSGCSALHSAIKKYGRENFIITQIDTAQSLEELDEKEKFWISFYNSISPNGYNLTSGGESKKIISERTKRKIGIKNKGKIISDWQKKQISKAWLGKSHTAKFRENLSKLYSGGNNPRAVSVVCVETGIVFETAKDAADTLSINHGNIVQVCKGKRKRAGGYHWKYVDEAS